MSKTPETENLAVFCDFENIALGVRSARYAEFDIDKVLRKEGRKEGRCVQMCKF